MRAAFSGTWILSLLIYLAFRNRSEYQSGGYGILLIFCKDLGYILPVWSYSIGKL